MAVEGLSIHPYFDHNFERVLANAVRREGFDVVIAGEVGNERLTDEEHLRWATAHGRTLVTYDRGDFQRLAGEWAARGEDHAGIIISVAPPRLPFRVVLRRLLNVLEFVSADEMVNRLIWLNDSWSLQR